MRPSGAEIGLALVGLFANAAVVVGALAVGLQPFTADGGGISAMGVAMFVVSTLGVALLGLAVLLWVRRWVRAQAGPHDGHPGS